MKRSLSVETLTEIDSTKREKLELNKLQEQHEN